MSNSQTSKTIIIDGTPLIGRPSGIGYYAKHLVEALLERGDVTIYALTFRDDHGKKTIEHKNLNWITLPYKRRFYQGLVKLLGVFWPVDKHINVDYDAVLYPNYFSWPYVSKAEKSMVIVHDLAYNDYPESLSRKNMLALSKLVPVSLKKADCVATISEFTARRIRDAYSYSGDVAVAPPACSENSVEGRALSKLKPGFVLFVSTLEPRKNVLGLVRGYMSLPESIQNKHPLVLAGGMGWNMDQDMQEIASYQSQGANIITPGYINDAEKEWLYDNAAMLVVPSHYEGFGMPVLEAMSHGLPTAVSDIEVFHEVAGDAAVYFDKDDPESIANAMEHVLLDKSVHRELVKKGNAQVKKFSWEKSAEIIYKQLVLQSDK